LDALVLLLFTVLIQIIQIFDSHARDIYGNSHPQGTCVLLHVLSIDNLVMYFQSLYGLTATYELKGIKIIQSAIPIENNQRAAKNTAALTNTIQSYFAISLYSICYSIISPCNYWNSNTLHTIVNNASLFNFTAHAIPESIDICESANIKIQCNKQSKGLLQNSCESKKLLETLISNNHMHNTGFVMSTLT
jgi:hypothetical protein